MSKKIIKLITLILCAVMCLSCVACNQGNSENPDEIIKVSHTGTHDISAKKTDSFLVKDGKTEYSILMPSNSGKYLNVARTELITLFKRATGITLSFASDNNVASGKKYISLGETNLYNEKLNLTKDEYSQTVLKTQGFIIKTVDDNIFILGGTDVGVINGVYKFLEIYFNYDYYYRNCIDIDTNVKNINFYDMDITDVPDIDNFFTDEYIYLYNRGKMQPMDYVALGESAESDIYYMNHRSGSHFASSELLMPIHEQFDVNSKKAIIHNVLEYLPAGSVSQNCYAQGGEQLCYTAHGNQEDLNKMIEMCAEKIIFSLKNYTPDKYPLYNYVTFTIEDTTNICSCETCKKEYAEIGYSGNLIRFANKMAAKVQEWLDAQESETAEFHNAYRENFKILIYAYFAYTDAPVDENNEPLAEDLICNENLAVWHVSSRGVSAHADIYDEKWLGAEEQVAEWKVITQKSKCLWFWHNSGNVVNNGYFSDGFTIYSNNFMSLMADANYQFIYAAHFYQGGGEPSAWQNALIYVQNKLRWDCNRDSDYYIRKYMDAMYKDASDTMYDLLQQERIYYANIVVDAKKDNNWGREIATKENFPYVVLKQWLDKCDKAISEIEPFKEKDENLYNVIKQRIEMEAAAQLYRIIELYGSTEIRPFSNSVLQQYKLRLKEIGTVCPLMKLGNVYIKDTVV